MTATSALLLRWAVPALALATALTATSVHAQQYPAGDIHFICGFPAGSGADAIVRFYGEKVRQLSGRNIVVENKPGAGANIAIEYAARAKPDGLIVLVHGGSGLATNMHLYKKPPVASVNDLQIFATINRQAFMLAVDAKTPYKTTADLTAAMKIKGEKASFASSAPASIVMGAIYRTHAGLKAVDVNYRTSTDAYNDLSSGALDFGMLEPVSTTASVRAGRLRVLAVSSGERLQAAPDLPTFAEQGIPINMNLWWAAMVPAATPKPIVEQLSKWFNAVTGSEDAKKFLNNFASDPWILTPEQAQAQVNKEVADWARYMQIAKLEPQG